MIGIHIGMDLKDKTREFLLIGEYLSLLGFTGPGEGAI